MYSPLEIHQVAVEEYNRALRKAAQRRVTSLVLRQQNELLSLEAILKCFRLVGQRSLGVCTVAVEKIIGTAGRSADFDREFMPRRRNTQSRWIQIILAVMRGKVLPPVELRKVRDSYFVMDGHHRISVARLRGQDFIDAEVVEMDIEGDLCEVGIC